MKKKKEPDMYTVSEVAEMLRVSEASILNQIKEGKMLFIKIGRQYRIPRRAINKLISGDNE